MTVPLHGAISYVVCSRFTDNPIILVTAVILGILPDIGRLLQKDRSNWQTWYIPAHDVHNRLLWFIPFWNLHIWMDNFVHKPKGGWNKWGIYAEIVLWILCAILLGKN